MSDDGHTVGVDLFGAAVGWESLPAGSIVLCATHGHPEHCGLFAELLRNADPERLKATHLLSSPDVVDPILDQSPLPAGNAHGVAAGGSVSLEGVRISTFSWQHLPILPPESLAAKAEYAKQLSRHPIEAARIAFSALRLPMQAPYLGFHITLPSGLKILNYSEGLHRMTNASEVTSVAEALPADVVMLAVEPEDTEAIPHWIEILSPSTVIIYEAHRPWREMFELPYVDLADYAETLGKDLPGIRVEALIEPGDRVDVAKAGG